MRARRAGTAAARGAPKPRHRGMPGAPPVARRGWAQLYRALPRAQPGPERSGGTRPHPAVRRSRRPTTIASSADGESCRSNWKTSKRMPELTLAEVARIAEGELESGDAALTVRGVRPLDEAG